MKSVGIESNKKKHQIN